MKKLRLTLTSACLARYLEGGGHWSAFLQYLWGFEALGHDVFWLEFLPRANPETDAARVRGFAERMNRHGFGGRWAVALFAGGEPQGLEDLELGGLDRAALRRRIAETDLLWDFVCSLRRPMLELFRRRVLVDLDPGIVQISAQQTPMDLDAHQVLFTAGLNIGSADCLVPVGGLKWIPFAQPVFLPRWKPAPPPAPEAPFTSITQWGWGELHFDGRVLSVSKRDAYMRYVDVPRRCGQSFELAANMNLADPTGDLPPLRAGGWRIVDPAKLVPDPESYQTYLASARAEFCCPKPIYTDLRTGWFSDRSAGFLACGRPVVMEETGLSAQMPTGDGLVCFRDVDSAVEAVARVQRDYAHHARAARRFAEDHLSTDRVLAWMLERCG